MMSGDGGRYWFPTAKGRRYLAEHRDDPRDPFSDDYEPGEDDDDDEDDEEGGTS